MEAGGKRCEFYQLDLGTAAALRLVDPKCHEVFS